ncbi:MAG: NUDIX domain-containing protein [Candidatus Saccharibacteria bacterium]
MKFKKSGSDSGFAVYENQQHGFRMRYPRDWGKIENFGDAIVAIVKPGKLLKKSLSENVNITFHDLSAEPMELDRFVEVSLEDLKTKIPGFTLMEEQDITLAGMPGKEITYFGDFKKKEKLQWHQILVKRNDRIYVITSAAPQDKFASFHKTTRTMLESFTWINTIEPAAGAPSSPEIMETHVVTCFVVHDEKILLLKRSGQVGTYQEKWAGVSGHIDEGNTPQQQALQELKEEVGLSDTAISSITEGPPVEVIDEVLSRKWVIHPFRVMVVDPELIKLDWEHTEYQWIIPEEMGQFETVPKLEAVWDSVK